jgi:hypothetical protein
MATVEQGSGSVGNISSFICKNHARSVVHTRTSVSPANWPGWLVAGLRPFDANVNQFPDKAGGNHRKWLLDSYIDQNYTGEHL